MATATELATFRRRIGDPIKGDQDVVTSNGSDKVLRLRFNNVFNLVVTINGIVTSAYTLNAANGEITLTSTPSANDLVKASYSYAAYTDAEAISLIDEFGLKQAIQEALLEIMASAAKLYNYSQGQTSSEQGQVFKNLKDLLDFYRADTGYTAADGSDVGGIYVGKRTHELDREDSNIQIDLSRLD